MGAYAHRPVSQLTDWDPLLLTGSMPVEQAALLVLSAAVDDRYPDVVVEAKAGRFLVIPATTLLRALAEECGQQSRYDGLTSLPNETASRLRAAARPSDLVARLAGDEFTILIVNEGGGSTAALAGQVAERLIAAVGQPIETGVTLRPRMSVGVAVSGEAPDADTLLREADQAMYAAKNAGGNRVVVHAG